MADFKVGDRVRLTQALDIFNLGCFSEGITGVVTYVNDEGLEIIGGVRLDVPHPDLDEWDNELQVFRPEEAEVHWGLFQRVKG